MRKAIVPAVPARERGAPVVDAPLGFAVGLAVPVALAVQGGGYDIVAHEATSLVVWWLVALGIAFSVLPRARPPVTARLPLIGFVLLAVLTAASLLWTSSAELTFDELARLVGYGGIAVLAFMTLHRGNWRAAAGGLTAGAVAVSALAVASRVDPGAFAGTSASISISGRLSYPLGYWNAIGAWGVMAFALALGWSTNRGSPMGRRVAMALLPTVGLSVYLSYSRGALIGAAFGLVALLVLCADRREVIANATIGILGAVGAILVVRTQPEIVHASGGAGGGLVVASLISIGAMCSAFADALARWRIGLAPWNRFSLAAVVVAAVALVVGARALPPQHVAATASKTPSTVQAPGVSNPASRVLSLSGARSVIWPQAVDAFASSPLHGIGPGTFEFWWDSHEGHPTIRDAHSLYLQMLSELGVPGLLAIAAIVLGLLAAALQATRRLRQASGVGAGLAAAFVVFCVQAGGDWLWKIPALVALAAIAAVAAVSALSEPREPGPLRGRRIVLAAAAILAGAVMIPGIVSTQLLRDSAALLSGRERAQAVDYARAAVSAEPWSATAHAALALSQQRRHQLAAARAGAERAVELEPLSPEHHVLLAVIDFQLGHTNEAAAELRRSAVLDSRNPEPITPASVARSFGNAPLQRFAP